MIWARLAKTGEAVRAVSAGHAFHAITESAIRRTRAVRSRNRRITVATAASVALALCLFWWGNSQAPNDVFQTSIGEHSTIKLPDGSSLELNSNTLVRIVYNDEARIVKLERGEGYFDVARDPRRPFWVAAGKSWVGAVGTAFSVDVRSPGVRVTVSEGAVKVALSGGSSMPPSPSDAEALGVRVLSPGQQLNVKGNVTELRSLEPGQLSRSLAWRAGQVYFKDDSLAEVVEELSRYSALQVVIESASLREFPIAGTFETNADGMEALLDVLSDGFELNVRREGRNIYISQ